MAATPTVDAGLTDVLDPLLGSRIGPVLDAIDARAGARVDHRGVHVRRLLRTVHVPWDRVARIRLDSRLDLALTFAVGILPITRAPIVGSLLASSADRVAEEAARRLAPGLRDRAGWAVATVEQQTWRRDVAFERTARAVALLYPALTHRLVDEARSRQIPVIRDDGDSPDWTTAT